MNNDVYRFWGVFSHYEHEISVTFPDLIGCHASGKTADQAYINAKQKLGEHIDFLENQQVKIPDPSSLEKLMRKVEDHQVLVDIQVYMPTIRVAMANKAIKKTLTIPKWLNDAAEKEGLNFSQILQEGLRRSLGIKNQ